VAKEEKGLGSKQGGIAGCCPSRRNINTDIKRIIRERKRKLKEGNKSGSTFLVNDSGIFGMGISCYGRRKGGLLMAH